MIGLDGLDPVIAERLLACGRLPNLARLRDCGGYARLATTYPAQTPVAWSSFATGTNPGGHGIFDFIRRDPQNYRPDVSLCRYEQPSKFLPPRVVNLRGGRPLWDTLAKAGISSTILRCPCTYPPDDFEGRLLSGMGVPDIRGGFGTGILLTTRAGEQAGESEDVVQVATGSESIKTALPGPRNPKTGERFVCELTLSPDKARGLMRIKSAADDRWIELRPRCWSDFVRVRFRTGALTAIRGIVRFYLVQLEPELTLYASPINFDPQSPWFAISTPRSYCRELSRSIGNYYTAGMVEEHTALRNGRIDEEAFLDQCQQVVDERERMSLFELDRLDRGLFYVLFDTPDRIQHMFWRFLEPDHPANRGRDDVNRWSHVIDAHYESCDRWVGKVLDYVDGRTLLIVASDHGFGSFRRGFCPNAWLKQEGLLATVGMEAKADASAPQERIDWSRTKAYAIGLSGIYLNRVGREGQGIVRDDEAASLRSALIDKLTGLVDSQRGAVGIIRAVARESVYRGPYTTQAPDIVINYARNYRASWASALGALAANVWEDNVSRWSGDHIVDPRDVPGVLFLNRSIRQEQPSILDLAPTILAAFGVSPDERMEGRCLLERQG